MRGVSAWVGWFVFCPHLLVFIFHLPVSFPLARVIPTCPCHSHCSPSIFTASPSIFTASPSILSLFLSWFIGEGFCIFLLHEAGSKELCIFTYIWFNHCNTLYPESATLHHLSSLKLHHLSSLKLHCVARAPAGKQTLDSGPNFHASRADLPGQTTPVPEFELTGTGTATVRVA
ncbi:hypothetical protein BJ138DRAFT_105506 [Hygrophoropsis aurantiaca]|uniref:Uncharacterized protein n=1 Tax=Hygrophoropsis aurantiaca TaxID=72124 RepID=A0ACB7ZS57_9AGAM|nr:hypothetical protein BJ138DRAFT_105506 [Hygrophoropsis aurantiaca]